MWCAGPPIFITTQNHCFAKNCGEGQYIAGISNAATVKNRVYFWHGVVVLSARVFQMSNLPSGAEVINRPDFAWLFFNKFCALK